MPIPMVLTSSDGFTGGMKYSRFGGPVFSGTINDGGSSGPLPAPGAVALIQRAAPLATQVVTSSNDVSGGSYVYITQGTVQVTASSGTVAAAPPYSGMGAALYYDMTRKKLCIFSTATNDWLTLAAATSS